MPNFPNPVNEILISLEEQYPIFLNENEVPDNPIVKIAYYYLSLLAIKEDPLDDVHLQIMLENCLKYEMNRLAKEQQDS